MLGSSTAIAVQEIVKAVAKPKSGTVAIVIGIAALALGASGVFGQLKDALNTIWGVEPKEDRGIMTLLKDYVLSFTWYSASVFCFWYRS